MEGSSIRDFKKNIEINRGDIFWIIFTYGTHPALVIQNDSMNKSSHPSVTVLAIKSYQRGQYYGQDIIISSKESGLEHRSRILINQIMTIDKKYFKKKIGKLSEEKMKKVDKAIKIHLALI